MAQVVLGGLGGLVGGGLGRIVGGALGRVVDNGLIGALGPAREGPRLEGLKVQGTAEGAPMACVFGRARVTGQIVWAARFLEKRNESGGGKGGPRTVDYDYSLSFAVALCEGLIDGIGRVWADGKPLATAGVAMRLYRGTEDQTPDPLIEAVEGEGQAPAWRGTAYVVFEDLPLGPFGNRPPQLSFEVFRRAPGLTPGLEELMEGVCLIPGAGEFALATEPVTRREGLTRTAAENVHHSEGRPDLVVSLDQLMAQAPNLKRVSLVVGWFGTSLRAGECEVRPGVERRDKPTEPLTWSVAGLDRGDAHLISTVDGRPAYGGTPSDETVRQAIRLLKSRGLEVTLYPFVFMDAPGYPWRGRIAGDDGAGAAGQIEALFGTADGWGLRRMARHYAALAAETGAHGLLIGSEMRGVTWTRDHAGGFPAVAQLRALAAECRGIVGRGIRLSYAADWSEYFGRQAGGEAIFHLDPLWADANIDYVGIDWYPPLSDWRAGAGGLDGETWAGKNDPAYLAAGVAGGEGFDWFYADGADRAAQVRTPIVDTAHGEHWLFRPKDLFGWWSNPHHDRPGGVRAATPTAWAPRMKPIRLTEVGCAAVDRGPNAPNLFQDPKSSENALPPHSGGTRDDTAPGRRHRPRRQPDRGLFRPRRPAAGRPARQAVHRQVAVMIGESRQGAIRPLQPPHMAQRRRPALDARDQFVGNVAHPQTLTSISGTAAIRPASKVSSVASIRSLSNRTGVSNWNPAVTAWPDAGAAFSVTTPVVVSTAKASGASSTPATATRTVPWTGLAIGRATSPYSLISEKARRAPVPAPSIWSIGPAAVPGAHDLWSAKSLKRNPCSRPRRASKKATSSAMSSSDRRLAPIR